MVSFLFDHWFNRQRVSIWKSCASERGQTKRVWERSLYAQKKTKRNKEECESAGPHNFHTVYSLFGLMKRRIELSWFVLNLSSVLILYIPMVSGHCCCARFDKYKTAENKCRQRIVLFCTEKITNASAHTYMCVCNSIYGKQKNRHRQWNERHLDCWWWHRIACLLAFEYAFQTKESKWEPKELRNV